jgi:hypothetical protein
MTTGIREIEPNETALPYSAMQELRPHLGAQDTLVERMNGAQRAEGHRLVGALVLTQCSHMQRHLAALLPTTDRSYHIRLEERRN